MVVEDRFLVDWLTCGFLAFGAVSFPVLLFTPGPYGRHGRDGWGFPIGARLAWFLQELPSLCLPIALALLTESPKLRHWTNRILLSLFLLHYFQRSIIFPFLIRGGKPTPIILFLLAVLFCTGNGYLQGKYLLYFADFPPDWLTDPRFIIGMAINIHSDYILRNLRKPKETGYRIPQGGLFELVSGANYFGEAVEWSGFALANFSLPTAAFAFCTFCILFPRSVFHHRWYLEKFTKYPKNRKIFIPFVV